ncbi:unnamed protein product [Linum trigynum]|uniref:Agglutinin domain-containing protein n=1 Tax=Linum trigynum TaxID=586398 RepID=A0AAV2DUD4_9ROSI
MAETISTNETVVGLPTFVAFRSKSKATFMHYLDRNEESEHYFECMSCKKEALDDQSPLVKLRLEPAAHNDKSLVHIRCCSNGKYLQGESRYRTLCIAATADQPTEDPAQDTCTLFQLEVLPPKDGQMVVVRLLHVHSKKYLIPLSNGVVSAYSTKYDGQRGLDHFQVYPLETSSEVKEEEKEEEEEAKKAAGGEEEAVKEEAGEETTEKRDDDDNEVMIERLRREVEAKDREIKDRDEAIQRKDKEIGDMKMEVEKMKAVEMMNEVEEKVVEMEKVVKEVEISKLKSEVEEMGKVVKEKDEEIAMKDRELEAKSDEIDELEAVLEELRGKVEKLKHALAILVRSA